MSDQDLVFDTVARYFALLSDPTRLRIMHAVCDAERTVNEIVDRTGGSQTNISRNLNLMHDRGALARRKVGSLVYYRVADQALIEMCRNVCQRVTDARRIGTDAAPNPPHPPHPPATPEAPPGPQRGTPRPFMAGVG